MSINHTPTSNPSGVVKAPLVYRYFIQKLSREGKTAGTWVYIEKLVDDNGFATILSCNVACKHWQLMKPDDAFRSKKVQVYYQ